MELGFEMQSPKNQPISLSTFEAAIKKKQQKTTMLSQISDFNKKAQAHSLGTNNDFSSSEFDISSWKGKQRHEQKMDFFQQEGKVLLGQDTALKLLDWRLTLVDLTLHLLALGFSIVVESILLLLLRDPLMILLNLGILIDYKLKIKSEIRNNILKVYKYVLIISGLVSVFTIGNAIFSGEEAAVKVKYLNYLMILICIGILFCQSKLWKACRYLIFFGKELEKKDRSQEIDFNDQL